MSLRAGILIVLLALPALATEKLTSVTVDGASYVQIQDVHVVSGGRIVLLYSSGGVTIPADKLPASFLASWGITDADIAASKVAAEKSAEQSLALSIRAGYFREVDGVVYDLRKPQPGWRQFTDAKILQVIDAGALVDPAPVAGQTTAVFVRNLPHIFADNERGTFMAKLTGEFTYENRFGYQRTIHAYDIGHICVRNEIPDAIVKNGAASAVSPTAAHSRPSDRPIRIARGDEELRGIGSGFFITKDGYLLTNFHVAKDAAKLEVEYKKHRYKAEVVQVDTVNDLALLKVEGHDFSTLAFSRKDSADLGDEVFTIGFPNIEMQGFEPKYTDGKISSLAGMQDDQSEYQISVPVQPGNSGGPLCDSDGQVVGIIVARLNDMTALRETGAVPQNVNYAVKARRAQSLLSQVKGLETLLTSTPSPAKPAKPIQAVENAIAMVRIY